MSVLSAAQAAFVCVVTEIRPRARLPAELTEAVRHVAVGVLHGLAQIEHADCGRGPANLLTNRRRKRFALLGCAASQETRPAEEANIRERSRTREDRRAPGNMVRVKAQ